MATISFTTKFNLVISPKQFILEDTADYAGQGILLADVNGVFNITSPSGVVIYNNTDYSNAGCDIRNSVDRINQTVIQLPLGVDGFPEVGLYTIVYSVYNSAALEYYTVTNTVTYGYIRPTVAIIQTVDCVSPLFTSTDTTNYVVNGVLPSITRQHVLEFPLGSGLPNLVSAAAVISVGFEQFANGTQSTKITTTATYVFPDGLTVVDSVTGAQEVVVDCTYVCAVYCGIRSIEQQMVAAQCNPIEYDRLTMLFAQIMALVQLAKLAIECGKPDDVNGYLTRMKLIGNFTDDCSCTTEAGLVTGLGGAGNTTIVESADATVIVTPVVVGSTTTYYVTLSTAFVNLVNTHYNTVVVAGFGVSVADSGIIGGVRTFTVSTSGTGILYAFSFAGAGSDGGLEIVGTGAPQDIAQFIFQGATYHNAQPLAYELLYKLSGAGNCDFVVRDKTNAVDLATETFPFVATPTRQLITIANPADAAIANAALNIIITIGDTFTLYGFNIIF